MAMESLTLISNPGSASRKYSIFNKSGKNLGNLHFEFDGNKIVCHVDNKSSVKTITADFENISESAYNISSIFEEHKIIKPKAKLERIGIRVVAPSSYFLADRLLNEHSISLLSEINSRAPLHIEATLNEVKILQDIFVDVPIIGISDSTFHATKPDYNWNYAIPLEVADKLEIKRFGYHGISASSVMRQLYEFDTYHPNKLVICHLGSGCSITAIKDGKSVETTMGYSPLEGLMMSSRSGSIDATALVNLKNSLDLDDEDLLTYLNNKSGLFGISGSSSDIRELIKLEKADNYRAKLALAMFVNRIQKAIGQMTADLDGIEGLIFTGTVGERSAIIRKRIIDGLSSFGLVLNKSKNAECTSPKKLEVISPRTRQKTIYVIPANEQNEMAMRINKFKL